MKLTRYLPVLMKTPYERKIRRLFGSALIAYWPLWEASGTVAADISGSGRNGAYGAAGAAPTLGQPGIGDGHYSPSFDGGDYVNVYGAGFVGAFNGAAGTVSLWVKMDAVGTWTDGANHYFCHFYVDGNNSINIRKTTVNNVLSWLYQAGGTSKTRSKVGVSAVAWMNLALTWDKAADTVQAYYNGVAEGAALNTLGNWAGALAAANTVLGAYQTNATLGHKGWLAYGLVLNRAATPAEVAAIAYAPFLD